MDRPEWGDNISATPTFFFWYCSAALALHRKHRNETEYV